MVVSTLCQAPAGPPRLVHTTLTSRRDYESHLPISKQGAKRDEIESSSAECGALFQPVRSVCPGDTPPPNHEQPLDDPEIHGPQDRAVLHDSGELRAGREFAVGPGRRCVAEKPRGWTTGQRAPARCVEDCDRGGGQGAGGGGSSAWHDLEESGNWR